MNDCHLNGFNKCSPASLTQINAFSSQSGVNLPQDYTAFLRQSNGGEGLIGPNSYLILWSVEELVSLNEAYQVNEYAPGLLLFGSDGGGDAYAFNTKECNHIVRVPFVGMDVSAVEQLADDFGGFLETLAKV